MATDREGLLLQIEANLKQYERELARANRTTVSALRKIERDAQKSTRNVEQAFSRMGTGITRNLRGLAAGLGLTLGTRELIQYADAWRQVGNTLRVSGVPAGEMQATMDRLFNIAQRSGTSLSSTVTLFGRLTQSAKELGATQEQLFRFTAGVGDALKIAGTDAGQASGALLQLSQALGSAVVRAEEFNSINEGARPILQAVANGYAAAEGSVAKLRAEVLAGKVSSADFFEAFLRGAENMGKIADQSEMTVSQAMTRLYNSTTKLIGTFDKWSGASETLIGWINSLADALGRLADNSDTARLAVVRQNIAKMQESIANGGALSAFPGLGALGQANNLRNIQLLQQYIKEEQELLRAIADRNAAAGRLAASGLQGYAPPVPGTETATTTATGGKAAKAGRGTTQDAHVEAYKRAQAAIEDYIGSLARERVSLEQEIATFGMTNAERERYIALANLSADATDKQRAAAEAEAAQIAELTARLEQLEARRKAVDEISKSLRDGFKGFFTDLANGVGPVEALTNALARLQQKLLDLVLNSLFDNSGIGAFLSGIIGGGGAAAGSGSSIAVGGLYHRGGRVGTHGTGRRVPASVFAGAPRMHRGGLAGDEVPAILQRGEMVLPRGAAARGVGGYGKVTVNNYGNSRIETRQSNGPDGRQLEILVREVVNRGLSTGMFDGAAGGRWGVQAVRRRT